ncbi:TetR/AcrR family transcriptional regulator [Streptomyces eurythermus]|uniref:TetR/AcrR family transcriptional regulator n=1 Tax=Streptomyces eurythermus TaxID=42237 RepID=UPI0033EE7F54
MTNRPYHHGDLPSALLAQAEQTLRDKGADQLSLRELARAIGVSPAARSRHFKTKQDLLDALAQTGFERLADAVAASQEGSGQTFAQRLDAAARAYVNFAVDNAALLELMFSAKHSPQASPALTAAAHRWWEFFLELIAAGQRSGEVRNGPLERIGLPVFAALHGYVGVVISGMLPHDLAEHGLDDVMASILHGCEPQQNPASRQPTASPRSSATGAISARPGH